MPKEWSVVCPDSDLHSVFVPDQGKRKSREALGSRKDAFALFVWSVIAWFEMPPKAKRKDSKLKNKTMPSQTVLFSNFIPSVDATNARPNKVTKPASGASTNESPYEYASNYLVTSLLHPFPLRPVSKSHYPSRKAREEQR